MTENRYLRIQELIFDSFLFNSPVEIEKGALLLDNKTKSIILQLRLNILGKDFPEISSVSIKIIGLDDAGEEIQGFNPFNYTYRDVYLLSSRTFGDRIPIILDSKVRQVKVELEKVIFKDGYVWMKSGQEFTPPEQQAIKMLNPDILEQLNRDTLDMSAESKEQIKYLPQQLDNYWLCTCGRPNLNSVEQCNRCEKDKKWVFETVSEAGIKKNLENHLENARRLEEEKRIRDDLHKKRTKKVTFISIGLGLLLFLFFYVLLPFVKYSQASNYLSKNDYDKAILLYEELGDYQNSLQMVSEAKYQKANDLLSRKQFDNSIKLFKILNDYKNSNEMIYEATFQKATDLLLKEEYDEAKKLFIGLANYKNSIEMVNETDYLKANELVINKNYDQAINLFTDIGDYKNSNELRMEAIYQKANELFDENQFELAANVTFVQLESKLL